MANSYIFGQGTPWSYEQLQNKRKVAEQLMQGMSRAPRNVGEGLNAIGDALLVRQINKKAAAEEERLRGEADALWSQVSGGGDINAIAMALNNPMMGAGQKAVLTAQLQRAMEPPKPQFRMLSDEEEAAMGLPTEGAWGLGPDNRPELIFEPKAPEPGFRMTTEEEAAMYGGPGQIGPDNRYYRLEDGAQKPPKDIQLYEYYVEQERAAGRKPLSFGEYMVMDEKAQVPGDGVPADEEELRKKLGGEEGTQWAGLLAQGRKAAGMTNDLEMLAELATMAPQGPVTGRLAGALTGFNSAADAFQSIVKRVAPTMRAEGSGSTSDIEYNGMLQSFPQLAGTPEGNQAIIAIMRAKAQIDIERSRIVSAYQNGDMDVTAARRALTELDTRSIMTPELKAVFGLLKPEEEPGATGGELGDEELIERYLEQNGG